MFCKKHITKHLPIHGWQLADSVLKVNSLASSDALNVGDPGRFRRRVCVVGRGWVQSGWNRRRFGESSQVLWKMWRWGENISKNFRIQNLFFPLCDNDSAVLKKEVLTICKSIMGQCSIFSLPASLIMAGLTPLSALSGQKPCNVPMSGGSVRLKWNCFRNWRRWEKTEKDMKTEGAKRSRWKRDL